MEGDGELDGEESEFRDAKDDRNDGEEGESGNRPSVEEICFRLAGIAGVDPLPLTMRRIKWMADAKDRADWDKWSALLAITLNCHVEKKYQVKPHDMNPYTVRKKGTADFAASVEAVHHALKNRG